ncbi:hypothetical protein C2H92_06070 [Bacillus halotolerans]|nr:hypothetical protein C2H92_06070 [Bacillus halotolerans]
MFFLQLFNVITDGELFFNLCLNTYHLQYHSTQRYILNPLITNKRILINLLIAENCQKKPIACEAFKNDYSAVYKFKAFIQLIMKFTLLFFRILVKKAIQHQSNQIKS